MEGTSLPPEDAWATSQINTSHPASHHSAPPFPTQNMVVREAIVLKYFSVAALLSFSPQRYRRLVIEERLRTHQGDSLQDHARASSLGSAPLPDVAEDPRAFLTALVEGLVYPFLSQASAAPQSSLFHRLTDTRNAPPPPPSSSYPTRTATGQGSALFQPTTPVTAKNANAFSATTPAAAFPSSPSPKLPKTTTTTTTAGGSSNANSRAGSHSASITTAAAVASTSRAPGVTGTFLCLSPFAGEDADGHTSTFRDTHPCYSSVPSHQLMAELAEPQFERFHRYMQGGAPSQGPPIPASHSNGSGADHSHDSQRRGAAAVAQGFLSTSGGTTPSAADGGSYLDPATGHYVSAAGVLLHAPADALRRHHQAFLRLLPPVLHSASGMAQVSRLCPALLPAVLEVLVKGSVVVDGGEASGALRDSIATVAANAMGKMTSGPSATASSAARAAGTGKETMANTSLSSLESFTATGTSATTTNATKGNTGASGAAGTTADSRESWTAARRCLLYLLERYASELAAQQRRLRALRRTIATLIKRLVVVHDATKDQEDTQKESVELLASFRALVRQITEDALPLAHALSALRTTTATLLCVVDQPAWAIHLAATMLLARVFPFLDSIATSGEQPLSSVPVLHEADKLLVYGPVMEEVAGRLAALQPSGTGAPGNVCERDRVGIGRLHALLTHLEAAPCTAEAAASDERKRKDHGSSVASPASSTRTTTTATTPDASGEEDVWDVDAEALGIIEQRLRREWAALMDALEAHAQEVTTEVSGWTSSTTLVFCLVTVYRQREESEKQPLRAGARHPESNVGEEGEEEEEDAASRLLLPDAAVADDAASTASGSTTDSGSHRTTSPAGVIRSGSVVRHDNGGATPSSVRGVVLAGNVNVATSTPSSASPVPVSTPARPGGATGPRTVAGVVVLGDAASPLLQGATASPHVVTAKVVKNVSTASAAPPREGTSPSAAAAGVVGSPLVKDGPLTSPTSGLRVGRVVTSTSKPVPPASSPPQPHHRHHHARRSRLIWRLPDRVPAQVTPTHMAILTAMTLCLPNGVRVDGEVKTASTRTVAALGQWFAQALVMHLADPSTAVEVHHHLSTLSPSAASGSTAAHVPSLHTGSHTRSFATWHSPNRLPSAKVTSACVALTHLLLQHTSFFSRAVLGGGTLASLRAITASMANAPSPAVVPHLPPEAVREGTRSRTVSPPADPFPQREPPQTSPPSSIYNIDLNTKDLLQQDTAKKVPTTTTSPPQTTPSLLAPPLDNDNASSSRGGSAAGPTAAKITDVLTRLASLLALRLLPQLRATLAQQFACEASQQTPGVSSDAARHLLSELPETHAALHLLLQSVLTHPSGEPFSAEAQRSVASLFLSWTHLLFHIHSNPQGNASQQDDVRRWVVHGFEWILLAVAHLLRNGCRTASLANAGTRGSPIYLCAALAPLAQRTVALLPFSEPPANSTEKEVDGADTATSAPMGTVWDALRRLLRPQRPAPDVDGDREENAYEPTEQGNAAKRLPLVLREYVLPALDTLEAAAEAAFFILSPTETRLPVSLRPHEARFRESAARPSCPSVSREASACRRSPVPSSSQTPPGSATAPRPRRPFLNLSRLRDAEDGDDTLLTFLNTEETTDTAFAQQYSTPAALAELKRYLQKEVLSAEHGSLLGVLPGTPEPFTLRARVPFSLSPSLMRGEKREPEPSQVPPIAAGTSASSLNVATDDIIEEGEGGLWSHQRIEWGRSVMRYIDRQWWFARADVASIGLRPRGTRDTVTVAMCDCPAAAGEGTAEYLDGCLSPRWPVSLVEGRCFV